MRSPLRSLREGLKEKGKKKKKRNSSDFLSFFFWVKPHDFLVPGFGGWAASPRRAKRCGCCAVWCLWPQDASCSLVPWVLRC